MHAQRRWLRRQALANRFVGEDVWLWLTASMSGKEKANPGSHIIFNSKTNRHLGLLAFGMNGAGLIQKKDGASGQLVRALEFPDRNAVVDLDEAAGGEGRRGREDRHRVARDRRARERCRRRRRLRRRSRARDAVEMQMLRRATRQVDAVFVTHHPHRVRVQRFGMAAGAVRLDGPARPSPGHRLGHLGPRAVAGAQEQRPHGTDQGVVTRGRGETKARVERPAGRRQQSADTRQIQPVVGVPAIGGAAPRGHETAVPQLAQVVRDQVLGLTEQPGQLVDHPVAPGQLTQKAPAQGMPRQVQELGRGAVRVKLPRHHGPYIHQSCLMHQARLMYLGAVPRVRRAKPTRTTLPSRSDFVGPALKSHAPVSMMGGDGVRLRIANNCCMD